MRRAQSVYWSDRLNAWVLTRYDDAYAALRDPRLISSQRVQTYANALPVDGRNRLEPLFYQIDKWIGNMDPPDHTRLRRLVNVAFTPRMVEQIRSAIEQVACDLLDDAAGQGEIDFISAFAYPLPAIVIAQMLGVPIDQRQRFMAWSDALTAYAGTGRPALQTACRASNAAHELTALFKALIDQRRAKPRGDLISALVQAEEQGDCMTEHEMLSMCGFLIVAGHETTMSLLANGMLALLNHPHQFERLKSDPSLTPSAVEECLRYDSPIQHQTRVAAEPLELGGKLIAAGQRVMPFLGAANRDPAQFNEPDRFDVSRTPNKHLAFGFGRHYCLGAPLARLEAAVAFSAIIKRFPDIRLNASPHELKWRHHTSNRSPVALPVTLNA